MVKTTLEIADPVYRQIKATAALNGQSVREFVNQAVEEKMKAVQRRGGWRALAGQLPPEAVAEMKAIVNEPGFREIEPEDHR